MPSIKNTSVFLSLFLFFGGNLTAGNVSMNSLLQELTDIHSVSVMQDYRCLHLSSYDRASVSPDEEGWFANSDRNWWIRIERDKGRREFVIMDDDTPGVIVRLWMTLTNDVFFREGILRIYIDGSEKPAIEGIAQDVLSGTLVAPYPLSASMPEPVVRSKRGHTLYLPIPYNSCKITFECDLVDENIPGRPKINKGVFYYNIEYRKYGKDVAIESFSPEILERNREMVCQTARSLETEEPLLTGRLLSLDGTLKPSSSRTFTIRGCKEIQKIYLNTDCPCLNSLLIEMTFDGEKTVRMPLGDFFCTGEQRHTYRTRYSSCDSTGLLSISLPMPFNRSCRIKFTNNSDSEVSLNTAAVRYERRARQKDILYFCCLRKCFDNLEFTPETQCIEATFLDIQGRGKYIGTAMSVTNGTYSWWGEGDEKIYVDDESFPSHFGTGTEDYFGYAWSSEDEFSHPLAAQPNGKGGKHPGTVNVVRWRALDAIPFQTSIRFNMELYQRHPGLMSYAAMSYLYIDRMTNINNHITQ